MAIIHIAEMFCVAVLVKALATSVAMTMVVMLAPIGMVAAEAMDVALLHHFDIVATY